MCYSQNYACLKVSIVGFIYVYFCRDVHSNFRRSILARNSHFWLFKTWAVLALPGPKQNTGCFVITKPFWPLLSAILPKTGPNVDVIQKLYYTTLPIVQLGAKTDTRAVLLPQGLFVYILNAI